MALRAVDVFTPGTYPVHNYVERSQQGLEQALRDGLDTPGQACVPIWTVEVRQDRPCRTGGFQGPSYPDLWCFY